MLGAWGLAADSLSAPPYWPWWQVLRAVANTVDLATLSSARLTTKELMARIGHASPRAALISQHATEQRDREIAAYLDDAIDLPS